MSNQLDKIFDEDYPWDRESTTYKDLESRVKFKGLIVTASGLVFRKDGKQVKPKYIFSTLKDGTRKIKSVNIEFSMKGTKYYKSYQRFVYAAWHEEFNMDDSSLVVVSKSENRFEFRPSHLEVKTRAEHLENLRKQNMKYTDEERSIIAEKYYEVRGDMIQTEFIKIFDISIPTLLEILKEYPENDN